MTLKKKLGSQKAISVGIDYLKKKEKLFYLTIMDSDGEDNPIEINKMLILAKKNKNKVITSHRKKRNENFIIQFGYKVHLLIAFIFTWNWISFGNFSTMHSSNLKIINLADVWYAYSSAILKNSKINKIYSTRQKRYFGKSKVGLTKLVEHSFRIIIVFFKRAIFTSVFLLGAIYLTNQTLFTKSLILLTIFNVFLLLIKNKNKPLNIFDYKIYLKNITNY